MRIVFLILAPCALFPLLAGCSGAAAVPGKVQMTSTEVFKNLKGSKSPPAQKPPP
jgi:hypothetical protein